MKRATIKDVAQATGYSIATVSLVINNKPVSIPQATRDSILRAAEALHYRPNQLAVSMITKRSKVLGLIIPDNSNEFFADLSKAIERAARHAGYGLIYGNSANDSQRDLAYMKMFSDRQVDGIIFAKSAALRYGDDDKTAAYMRESAIPFITVDRNIPGSGVCSVSVDHFQGGYLATRHLLALGHRRIGAYTGSDDVVSSNERLAGYRAALAEAGVPYREEFVVEGNYQLGGERRALTKFLNQRVTAIFSFNDLMAFGLYRELRAAHLSVPGDVSIVGFDNVSFGDLVDPPLTTVSQPVAEMGACVVDTLLRLIDHQVLPADKRHQLFEPRLVVRGSTAPYQQKDVTP